jgi:hypothetical protein
MYIVYVDESGDVGIQNSPSDYFCLSAIVIHESKWQDTLDRIIVFRKHLRLRYGFKLREEIHSSHFIHKPGDFQRIHKSLRLRLLRDAIDFQATLPDYQIINVVVNKKNKSQDSDIFKLAWQTLIQRIENTLKYRNFVGSNNINDTALLFVDKTDEIKLRNLTRKMRRFNPVPNAFNLGSGYRMMPMQLIVEDAVHRDSAHSYFIQLADVNAYFLNQKFQANKYVRKQGGRNYLDRLKPVLFKHASNYNQLGIVIR